MEVGASVVDSVCAPAPTGKQPRVAAYPPLAFPTPRPKAQTLDVAVFDWGLVPNLDNQNSLYHAFALSEYAVILTLVQYLRL